MTQVVKEVVVVVICRGGHPGIRQGDARGRVSSQSFFPARIVAVHLALHVVPLWEREGARARHALATKGVAKDKRGPALLSLNRVLDEDHPVVAVIGVMDPSAAWELLACHPIVIVISVLVGVRVHQFLVHVAGSNPIGGGRREHREQVAERGVYVIGIKCFPCPVLIQHPPVQDSPPVTVLEGEADVPVLVFRPCHRQCPGGVFTVRTYDDVIATVYGLEHDTPQGVVSADIGKACRDDTLALGVPVLAGAVSRHGPRQRRVLVNGEGVRLTVSVATAMVKAVGIAKELVKRSVR